MWTYTLIAIVLVLWLIYRKRCFSIMERLGIPGPKPNLLFGNLLELVWKTPIQCHKEWFEKYGKIVGYYFGTSPVVLVADPDLLKKIQVSEFHKFINRPNLLQPNRRKEKGPPKRVEGFSQHLVTLRDKRWKEIRSIITPTFTASKMKQMTPIMNGAIDSLIQNVEKKSAAGEQFDIYTMYQGLTMDVIGRTAFGIQTDVQNDPNDPFLKSAKVLFSNDIRSPLLLLAISFQALSTFWTWLSRLRLRFMNQGSNPVSDLVQSVKEVIAMRRKDKESRRPDLLQLMIDAEIDDLSKVKTEDLIAKDDKDSTENKTADSSSSSGKLVRRMTDADVLDNSVLFFLAAYETTSTAMAFTTHFLLHYPEAQEKIRQEVQELYKSEGELDYNSINKLQYLDQVLQESLRLYPPIYLFVSRECSQDVDLGNLKLEQGMAVQVPAFHLHRDPDIWGSDAEEFKPERFTPENKSKIHPMAFQAFGAGPRNCVGMRFAYMEAKLALARILSKYRLEKSSKTEGLNEITLKIAPAVLNPKLGIWLRAVPL